MSPASPSSSGPEGRTVVVVGCGNAGHVLAADMARKGMLVRVLDPLGQSANLAPLQRRRAIELLENGRSSGTFSLDAVGRDAALLLDGAHLVLIAMPAPCHRAVAEEIAAHIPDSAIVILFCGGLGALEWPRALHQQGKTLSYPIVETSTLPYAARITGPAQVTNLLTLPYFSAGVFPACRRTDVERSVRACFPAAQFGDSILEPCLRNVNGVIHPPVMLMNIARIESGQPWKIWRTGVTEAVARTIDAVDAERLALARAFGLDLPSIAREQYLMGFGPDGDIRVALSGSEVLAHIDGPTTVAHRFLTEDVPCFLSILAELADVAGTPNKTMRAVQRLAQTVQPAPLTSCERTLRGLGLNAPAAQALLDQLTETDMPLDTAGET